MSVDLKSASGAELNLGGGAWDLLLRLGEAYGWVPAGTQAPRRRRSKKPWPGNYDSSDGQRVAAEDAAALAAAFERAAKDPGRAKAEKAIRQELDKDVLALAKKHGIEIPDDLDDDEYVPVTSDDLRALIVFLGGGAFEIS